MTFIETSTADYVWTLVGFTGQMLFFSRFFAQWLSSERAGRSVIPISFWYLSIVGGFITLVYAIHVRNLVFCFGQIGGVAVYARNLLLIWRENRLSRPIIQ